MSSSNADSPPPRDLSTREVAQWLGVTVRTVQLMVDRGDLQAWKTTGGHRRIDRASVEAWRAASSVRHLAQQRASQAQKIHRILGQITPTETHVEDHAAAKPPRTVVLIEPDLGWQQRIRHGLAQAHLDPPINLHVAADAVTGLTLCSGLQPDALVVNLELPGLDGLGVIRGLANHPTLRHLPVVALLPPGWHPPTPSQLANAQLLDLHAAPDQLATALNR